MKKKIFYGKILASLILALLISTLLTRKVFFAGTPVIKPTFKKNLAELPSNLSKKARGVFDYLKKRSKGIVLAPPWVSPDVDPYPTGAVPGPATIAFPSPTGSPNKIPTIPQRKPTSGPTNVPIPTSTPQPTSTPKPTNTPTPTPFPTVTPVPPSNVLTGEERTTIDLINQRRQQMGRRTLSVNNQLVHAARRHSKDLAEKRRCGHTGSDGSDPWRRAKEAGYRGRLYGETVGCGYTTPPAVVEGWWGSPPHREILTNPSVTQIGIGWWDARQTALVGY